MSMALRVVVMWPSPSLAVPAVRGTLRRTIPTLSAVEAKFAVSGFILTGALALNGSQMVNPLMNLNRNNGIKDQLSELEIAVDI
jgi:ABC-type transport system involved in cytochrome c biogenesis permease subunit